MIEFKQIIGAARDFMTAKAYFHDLRLLRAHHHFNDPEWDGEPLAPEPPAARESLNRLAGWSQKVAPETGL